MHPRSSCDRLRHEHALITRVLAATETLTARMRGGHEVPAPLVSSAMRFFADFVDRCHEATEDEALLPMLARYGPPDEVGIEALQAEHAQTRRLADALRQLCDDRRLDGVAMAAIDAYLPLLRAQLAREEAAVLPYAERVLTPADEARLARSFDEVEQRAMGPGGREAVLALGDAVVQASQAIEIEGASELLARHVMRPRPGTVGSDRSLAHAAALMASLGTREVAVIDGAMLVGILTRSDMEPHRGHYEWTPVRAAMTPHPVAVDGSDSVACVARVLLERSFNSVPVLENERLVGIIGRADLLRLLAHDGRAGGCGPERGSPRRG